MERLPQNHLLNIIKSTRDHHPNFILMLGAGASVTSKVSLVKDMLKDWREKYTEMYSSHGEHIDVFLKKQNWYQTPEEYSILFEKLFDQPSQRREYIETCIKDASPSWGYIYLVNLLRKKVFNTIFTTNFDDLLNEACYLFSGEVRPIVCAHDSSISSIRITSQRPKIIKLHGDFLFDNIKNTVRELETLEQNTQEKFKQYASEFGFIVLGYSGNDRSIMDTFNTLLRFENYFPHGIYWCVRKGSLISEKVDLLTRYSKFKIVEIDGFDEFFAEVHSRLELPLQEEMSNPYAALADRLNKLTERIRIPDENSHPVIDKDIKNLVKHITKISGNEDISVDTGKAIEKIPIPYGLLADTAARGKKYKEALIYRLKEIEKQPSTRSFSSAFSLLVKSENFDCEDKLLTDFYNAQQLYYENPIQIFDIAIILIDGQKYDLAEKILNWSYSIYQKGNGQYSVEYYNLNLLQIKRYKQEDLTKEDLELLNNMTKSDDDYARMGAFILLNNPREVENILINFMDKGEDIDYILSWPIYKLISSEITNTIIKEKE